MKYLFALLILTSTICSKEFEHGNVFIGSGKVYPMGNLSPELSKSYVFDIELQMDYWKVYKSRVGMYLTHFGKNASPVPFIFAMPKFGFDYTSNKWWDSEVGLGLAFFFVRGTDSKITDMLLSDGESDFGYYIRLQSPELIIGDSWVFYLDSEFDVAFTKPRFSYFVNLKLMGGFKLW